MKRLLAVVLALTLMFTALFCTTAGASPDMSDLIRFIPTEIVVSTNKVEVSGYFVNLNGDVTVKDFTDFEMEVYQDGELLVEGSFGEIDAFSIKPLSVQYQSFTFDGAHELNEGTYSCGDTIYAAFTCNYKYV